MEQKRIYFYISFLLLLASTDPIIGCLEETCRYRETCLPSISRVFPKAARQIELCVLRANRSMSHWFTMPLNSFPHLHPRSAVWLNVCVTAKV